MVTRNRMTAVAAALLITACSEEPQPEQTQQQAAEITPGQYEISWTVTELQSTDQTQPASDLAVDGTGTGSGCIGEGGEIDPALFAEANDECSVTTSYVRNGRINAQLNCSRDGHPGQIMQTVNGRSTADGLEGDVSTTTYLSGSGDYEMTRSFTGRRVGECSAAAAPATAQ